MFQRPIQELFELRKITIDNPEVLQEGLFKKKPKKPIYNNSYGKPVSEKDKEDMIKLFEKTIKDVTNIVKSALPGCKLDDTSVYKKVTEYENANLYHMNKGIINIEKNYKIIQSKCKGSSIATDDFYEADGNELGDVLEKLIFNKVEKLGFEEEGSYGMYEHKKYEQIAVVADESFETIAVSLIVACEPGVIEESFEVTLEGCEIVEEGLFRRKKKDDKKKEETKKSQPKKQEQPKEKEYPAAQIKSEITKIKAEVNRLFRTEDKLKEFKNNGLELVSDSEIYDYTEPMENDDGEEVFLSGDEFWITRMDLWDYKGGNPRIILQDTGDHPVYGADNLIREKITDFLKDKYPHFKVEEDGGDWDTSSMNVSLR